MIRFDPRQAGRAAIERALEGTSCCAPAGLLDGRARPVGRFTRQVLTLFGIVLGAVLFTGLLPLLFAAAAQSPPDLGILANSSRLLRQRWARRVASRILTLTAVSGLV